MMIDKEIIIDGIKYFKQSDINKGLDEEHYVTEFHLLATHYNLLLEDYGRKYNSLQEQLKHKEQECEALKKQLEQQEALTETYKACYRAKHNDVKDEFIKLKQIIDEIKEYCELDNIYFDDLPFRTQMDDILDIIKKTKEK